MGTQKTTLIRDYYGSLRVGANTTPHDCALLQSADELIRKAVKAGKILTAYDTLEWDRKKRASGSARHHEIYDLSVSAVLLCVRETIGTKYGVSTSAKNYHVIRKCGRGVVVQDAPKAVAAKAAKALPNEIGYALDVCLRKEKLVLPVMRPRTGYKLVERTESGYRSCWDKSVWAIGRARTEKAQEEHSGGLFYYASLDEALEAAAKNQTFGDARGHRRLAVLEVEASGREIAYANGKLCATRIKPLRDVASTL